VKGADWDSRYAAAERGLFGDAPNLYLTMIVGRPDFAARSMLLPADGDGRNGTWAAQQGMAVTAVDLSEVATGKALARDAAAGVLTTRVASNLMDWDVPVGCTWDAAAILFLQGPAAVRSRAVAMATAALAPGGWLILEGFAVAQAGGRMGPTDPERLYALDTVLGQLAGWTVIEALTGTVMLDEGPSHRGLAHVVRLAARKPH
jgi:hypothetical protein